jgi:hypothetical protein
MTSEKPDFERSEAVRCTATNRRGRQCGAIAEAMVSARFTAAGRTRAGSAGGAARKPRARDKGVDDVLAQDEELRSVAREVLLETMRDPNAKQSNRLAAARALYSYGPAKPPRHRAMRT